jgi:ATP-dependent DNA ligase
MIDWILASYLSVLVPRTGEALFAFPSFIPTALWRHPNNVRPPRIDAARLTLVRLPFDDPDFLFELKHDGFRSLAYIFDGQCQLISRRWNPYRSFRELTTHLAQLKAKSAVIDGELVCFDSEGRSMFNELLLRKGCPIFYAFDLLHLNGRDLRQLPLIKRREKLRTLVGNSGLDDVICGKYVEERGIDLFKEVCKRNLEGVVAKRKMGTYSTVSGWLKIKNPHYTQTERRHELFESFKVKQSKRLVPVPKKPPVRTRLVPRAMKAGVGLRHGLALGRVPSRQIKNK